MDHIMRQRLRKVSPTALCSYAGRGVCESEDPPLCPHTGEGCLLMTQRFLEQSRKLWTGRSVSHSFSPWVRPEEGEVYREKRCSLEK